MRNILLTSTAAVCLMLTAQVAQAQSDQQSKKHEQKVEHSQKAPDAQPKHAEKQMNRRSTTGQSTDEKTNKSESASEKKDQSAPKADTAQKSERQEHNRSASEQKSNETNKRSASEQKPNEKMNKASTQEKQTPNEAKKSDASESKKSKAANESNKSKAANEKAANEKADEQTKKNTASEQKPSENKASTAQAPDKAEQKDRNAATEKNKHDAATEKNTNTTNNTTNNITTNKSAQNQTNPSGNLDPQKRVRISETISKHRDLADPVRNLNISITVGERVPSRIHLHALPREIVTIAPEYRGYDYFTTEEDVVIVSPRTHEIVSRIPRDASRARAEVESGSSGLSGGSSRTTVTTTSAGGGSAPCQVFRRTASGDLDRMDPSQLRETTGSGNSDHLAVKVQAPNGQDMPEVTLQQQEGRIIAETDGDGCRIILEPGKMTR